MQRLAIVPAIVALGLFGLPSGAAPEGPEVDEARDAVIRGLEELIGDVEALDPKVFRGSMKKHFASRLQTAVHRVEEGDDHAAASQLRSVRRTTDGCVPEGPPDRNDWVLDCPVQRDLHQRILRIETAIEKLD